jgi:hypothetical protein
MSNGIVLACRKMAWPRISLRPSNRSLAVTLFLCTYASPRREHVQERNGISNGNASHAGIDSGGSCARASS